MTVEHEPAEEHGSCIQCGSPLTADADYRRYCEDCLNGGADFGESGGMGTFR